MLYLTRPVHVFQHAAGFRVGGCVWLGKGWGRANEVSWEIELGGEVGIASIAILICVYLFIAICHLHLSGQSACLVVSLDIACFRL